MDSRKPFVACLIAVLHFLQGVSGSGPWGYYGDNDASHWVSIDSKCGGTSQSPIDIDTSTVTTKTFPEFVFTGFDTTNSLSLKLYNNGHTAKLSISGTVKVSGGGLSDDYNVAQLHFHWGKTNDVGSEHLLNGKQYPMEMHIVTFKASYGTISEAIKHSDGLAVLGFFFQIGSNPPSGLQKIVDVLPNINAEDSNHTVAAFPIKSLIPSSLPGFFRYSGSLTTPTCNEVVTWTVFAETIKITESQLQAFRNLQAGEMNDDNNYKMYNNYRPVQGLNGRKVQASFDISASFRPSVHLSLAILPFLSFLLKSFV